MERLLADDVVFTGDGGGKAPARFQPLEGSLPVARFIIGLSRRAAMLGWKVRITEINGQPGLCSYDAERRLLAVLALDIWGGSIRAVHAVINPDKLRHLGDVGDLAAALSQRPPIPRPIGPVDG